MQECWTFPRDEGLDYRALWRAPDRYLVIAEYATAAARSFGIQVSAATTERWFRLMACSYYLDQLLDDTPLEHREEAREIYQRFVQDERLDAGILPDWVNPDLPIAAALFSNAMAEIGLSEEFHRITAGFLSIARAKALEQRAWRYGRIVSAEGRLMGQFIAECMSDSERQGRRHKQFRRWFSTMGAGGTLLDGASDLTSDRTKALMKVTPSPRNRLKIALYCLAVSARLGFHPRVLLEVIASALRFWGAPFDLEHESWGQPAATWRVKIQEAQGVSP